MAEDQIRTGTNKETEEAPNSTTQNSALNLLRVSGFTWFLTGATIASGAHWLQQVSVNWLVYDLTSSGALLGTVNLVAAKRTGNGAHHRGDKDRAFGRSGWCIVRKIDSERCCIFGRTIRTTPHRWTSVTKITTKGAWNFYHRHDLMPSLSRCVGRNKRYCFPEDFEEHAANVKSESSPYRNSGVFL